MEEPAGADQDDVTSYPENGTSNKDSSTLNPTLSEEQQPVMETVNVRKEEGIEIHEINLHDYDDYNVIEEVEEVYVDHTGHRIDEKGNYLSDEEEAESAATEEEKSGDGEKKDADGTETRQKRTKRQYEQSRERLTRNCKDKPLPDLVRRRCRRQSGPKQQKIRDILKERDGKSPCTCCSVSKNLSLDISEEIAKEFTGKCTCSSSSRTSSPIKVSTVGGKVPFNDRMQLSVKLYDIRNNLLHGKDHISIKPRRGRPPKTHPSLNIQQSEDGQIKVSKGRGRPRLKETSKTLTLKELLAQQSDQKVDDSKTDEESDSDDTLPLQPETCNSSSTPTLRELLAQQAAGKLETVQQKEKSKMGPQSIKYTGERLVYTYAEENESLISGKPQTVLNVLQMPGGRFVYKLNKGESITGAMHKLNYHKDINQLYDDSSPEKKLQVQSLYSGFSDKHEVFTEEEKEKKEREDYEKSLREFMLSTKTTSPERKLNLVIGNVHSQREQDKTSIASIKDLKYEIVLEKEKALAEGRTSKSPSLLELDGVEFVDLANLRGSGCTFCHLRFVPDSHHTLEHQSDNYLCNLCGVSFRTQLMRNLHSAIHIKPPPQRVYLRCTLCANETFKGSNCQMQLQMHVETKHADLRHSSVIACPICDMTFIEKSLMRCHVDLHRPVNSDCTCNQRPCYGCFVAPPNAWMKESNPMKACIKCQFKFINLKRHQETHYIENKKPHFRCTVCSVKFLHKELAMLHMKIHTSSRPKMVSVFTCSICYEKTNAISSHVVEYHPNAPRIHNCKYCDMTLQEEGLLFLHERAHWPTKQCICNRKGCKMCAMRMNPNSRAVTPTELEGPTITPVTKFSSFHAEKTECYVCHLRFLDVDDHIKYEHVPKSKFRCSSCKAGFVRKSTAQFHVHVHTGLQLAIRNICSICKDTLEGDLYTHVSEKHVGVQIRHQFRCTLCHIHIPEENLYRMHLISHIPKSIQCNEDVVYVSSTEDAMANAARNDMSYYDRDSSSVFKTRHQSCQTCYLNIENLDEHALEHRPNKAKFRCRVCKVTFHTEAMSSAHAHIHCYKMPTLNLACSLCKGPVYSTAGQLIGHALTNHTEELSRKGAPSCGICLAVYPEENSLQAHKNSHMPRFCRCRQKDCKYCTWFSCKHCGEFFNLQMKSHYLVHMEHCNQFVDLKEASNSTASQVIKIARVTPYQRSEAVVANADAKPTPRRVLPSSTASAPLLVDSDDETTNKDTSANDSPDQGSTYCVSCGVQIKSGTIAEHLRRYHNKPLSLFACNKCNFKAADSDALLRHKISHLPFNIYHCLFCSEHFKMWNDLLQHNYTVHFAMQHRCNICQMYFTDVELLKRHNRMNSWNPPRAVPCNYCCRSFTSVNAYKEHKAVHGPECNCNMKNCTKCIKFRCSCSAVFKAHQFVQYMLHMRSCYQCYGCDINFDNAEDLEDHEYQHYLKCEVCGVRRKTQKQLHSHMAGHNCMCPADNIDCLFCKKAWCTICRTRFVRTELSNYREHKNKCPDSDLLCICREKDCIICQNAKCTYCDRTFKKYRFASFSVHVRACMGESPDPFAPAPKRMKIKEEPVDVEFSRKRKVVDNTVIPLDSDSDFDDEVESDQDVQQSELTRESFGTATQPTGNKTSMDNTNFPARNIFKAVNPGIAYETTRREDEDLMEEDEEECYSADVLCIPTTAKNKQHDEFTDSENEDVASTSRNWQENTTSENNDVQCTGSTSKSLRMPEADKDADGTLCDESDIWQREIESLGLSSESDLITVTPQKQTSQTNDDLFVPQPISKQAIQNNVYCILPQLERRASPMLDLRDSPMVGHRDSPIMDASINRDEQGIICVAPSEPEHIQGEEHGSREHKIITICPEPIEGLDNMDNMIMDEYLIDPAAKFDQATGLSFDAGGQQLNE